MKAKNICKPDTKMNCTVKAKQIVKQIKMTFLNQQDCMVINLSYFFFLLEEQVII